MDLTNEQWAVVAPHLPKPRQRADGKGRPRHDDRAVLNGILWVLRTGAPWKDLPDRYPSSSTCHLRFQEWNEQGVWPTVLSALSEHLDLTEASIDATFASAKKGEPMLAKPNGARERRLWRLQTAMAILGLSQLLQQTGTKHSS